ncbi:hypothetical protein FBZ93_12813 [Bradyrhizobium macuxiense]|uniref:Cysteine dioxygenase n=1 Tax=Bradyrhizobium macuxiense TaxID=1755647 RepID=A0A560KU29_9BRAD|nr:hypothetical protein [Bradyrhizobium macuxiense]TWB86773.1 hypothetical protein FBZ93_12813 [Bradyrhizobium macuxiense]
MIELVSRWLETNAEFSTQEHLEACLLKIVEQWPLDGVLGACLANAELLASVAARSYRHANGFDRIELITSVAGRYSLRLHAWWGQDTAAHENIHSHPWCFASSVLAGKLWFEQYVEATKGEQVAVFLYSSPSGESYNLSPAGDTALQLVLRGGMHAGSSYSAHSSLIHRVWTEPNSDTITLMLHGEGLAYPSRVFAPSGADRVFYRDRPSPDGLRATLERIRGVLAASTGGRL